MKDKVGPNPEVAKIPDDVGNALKIQSNEDEMPNIYVIQTETTTTMLEEKTVDKSIEDGDAFWERLMMRQNWQPRNWLLF